MRTIACLLGFVVFGLVLFFIIGNVLIDESWFDACGSWDWVAAIGAIVADIFVPIPTTLVITVMGQRHGPLLGGAIGTLGCFSAGVAAYGLTRLLGRRFAKKMVVGQ